MTRAAILLALIAAGCASAQPAPISYGRGGSGAAPPPAAQARTRPPIVYQGGAPAREQRAEPEPPPRVTHPPAPAPDWADGEGTPLSAYALQPGEAQPFDPAHLPRTHRVSANESLYDIASTYQVPLRALIDQNHIEPPYALSPGRELQLPPPRFHTVERGESFEDVARRYNVDLRSLALLNRMQPPYRVRRGDRVVLPAMARDLPPPAAAPAPTPVSTTPAPSGPARFAWPMQGTVIARYGAQPGGARLDGIEIGGREGDRISAAGDGEVVYAGNDLPAYGTLVLIRHSDEYVTAYGFARRALVREGQRVRTGEAIAELGSRGDGHPRLLFQVRRGSAAIDPSPLLPPP